ncbi:hypothetical protein LC065_20285 (plasmid) [Halobacillus litoralis]|uniref:hypothetical protein n=1 Tax=Halobacillus litoralis TaxID=45668 RepID=UPI001CFC6EE2|nr:hypothetical protein [Halobacillus litoralis]WLR49585.1 hypothetical protein LC065_20285 [Halobacillus litoralis]
MKKIKTELFISNIPKMQFTETDEGYLIEGIEAFKAGNWKGTDYSVERLSEMVNNFQKFSEEGSLEPPFKVDHSESARDQVGWIKNVYLEGDTLFADALVTEPDAVAKIQRGTWKKVSAEIYKNYVEDNTKEQHGMTFRALSIVSIPHLKGLEGIAINSEELEGENELTKEELQAILDQKFSELNTGDNKADFSEVKTEIQNMFSDYENLRAKADEADTYKEDKEKLEKQIKAQEIKGKIAGFSEAGKVVPAQEKALTELLASFTEEQEAKFNEFMENAEKTVVADEQSNYSEDDGSKSPEELAREIFGDSY